MFTCFCANSLATLHFNMTRSNMHVCFFMRTGKWMYCMYKWRNKSLKSEGWSLSSPLDRPLPSSTATAVHGNVPSHLSAEPQSSQACNCANIATHCEFRGWCPCFFSSKTPRGKLPDTNSKWGRQYKRFNSLILLRAHSYGPATISFLNDWMWAFVHKSHASFFYIVSVCPFSFASLCRRRLVE